MCFLLDNLDLNKSIFRTVFDFLVPGSGPWCLSEIGTQQSTSFPFTFSLILKEITLIKPLPLPSYDREGEICQLTADKLWGKVRTNCGVSAAPPESSVISVIASLGLHWTKLRGFGQLRKLKRLQEGSSEISFNPIEFI